MTVDEVPHVLPELVVRGVVSKRLCVIVEQECAAVVHEEELVTLADRALVDQLAMARPALSMIYGKKAV